MSNVLSQASREWAKRPTDQRFLDLEAMHAFMSKVRGESKAGVVSSRDLEFVPDLAAGGSDMHGLSLRHRAKDTMYRPTHWSFGQAAQLAEAPAGYLRTLPAPIVCDALNYGLKFKRAAEDVGILTRQNGHNELRAATGPKYGRIWNDEVIAAVIKRFGNGVDGDFRVPGEFGTAVQVTTANTTLFASDRDFFIFLADEKNRIEVKNRRDGKDGGLARGFFMWNSEVGAATFGVGTFLFDYVCKNRNVWGAEQYREIKLRHTVSAPDRFIDEVTPVLIGFQQSSTKPIEEAIAAARQAKIDTDVSEFLAKRFGKRMAQPLMAVHENEENRPIETLWDASNAVTAYARNMAHQDERVAMEREGGKLLDLAVNAAA